MFGHPSLPERFWSKVVQTHGGCWVWVGAIDTSGYGIAWNGRRIMGAHRLAYEMLVGAVPDGLVLDHRVCDLPCCVNPAHMEPATHRANIIRGTAPTADNARKTHCKRGHELTADNVYRRQDGRRECCACTGRRASPG